MCTLRDRSGGSSVEPEPEPALTLAEWRTKRQAARAADADEAQREDTKAVQRRVLAMCPKLKIGDVWRDVWLFPGMVVITGWKSLEEDGIPWPMVTVELVGDQLSLLTPADKGAPMPEKRKGEVGMPAFMFGKRVKAGKGKAWAPEDKPKKARLPRTVYLDQERK